jgi:hypothetical protein
MTSIGALSRGLTESGDPDIASAPGAVCSIFSVTNSVTDSSFSLRRLGMVVHPAAIPKPGSARLLRSNHTISGLRA